MPGQGPRGMRTVPVMGNGGMATNGGLSENGHGKPGVSIFAGFFSFRSWIRIFIPSLGMRTVPVMGNGSFSTYGVILENGTITVIFLQFCVLSVLEVLAHFI